MYTEVSHPRRVHPLLNNYSNISFETYICIKDTHLNLQNNKEINQALYHKTMSHTQLRKH